MKLTLTRYHSDSQVTLGVHKFEGLDHPPIFTLENPWRDNKENVSCIPVGNYRCAPFSGEKYQNVYQVLDVPDRTFVLHHWGNYTRNTKGCILSGLGVEPSRPEPMITHSMDAINLMRRIIGDQEFDYEVRYLC